MVRAYVQETLPLYLKRENYFSLFTFEQHTFTVRCVKLTDFCSSWPIKTWEGFWRILFVLLVDFRRKEKKINGFKEFEENAS